MLNLNRFTLSICASSVSLALLAGCSNSLMGSKGTLGNTGSAGALVPGRARVRVAAVARERAQARAQDSPPPAQNPGNVLSNLQASRGWNSWGELAPAYAICTAPCPGVSWSLAQGDPIPLHDRKGSPVHSWRNDAVFRCLVVHSTDRPILNAKPA